MNQTGNQVPQDNVPQGRNHPDFHATRWEGDYCPYCGKTEKTLQPLLGLDGLAEVCTNCNQPRSTRYLPAESWGDYDDPFAWRPIAEVRSKILGSLGVPMSKVVEYEIDEVLERDRSREPGRLEQQFLRQLADTCIYMAHGNPLYAIWKGAYFIAAMEEVRPGWFGRAVEAAWRADKDATSWEEAHPVVLEQVGRWLEEFDRHRREAEEGW